MSWSRRVTAAAPVALIAALVSCGASTSPSASVSGPSTTTPAVTIVATLTPVPLVTAAATESELAAVAASVYPRCTSGTCIGTAMFTTCDAASSGSDVFAGCPFTSRLATQLESDVAGVASAPDPLGGGQDPEWTTEAFSASPSTSGGVVHVSLGFGTGTSAEKIDLLMVLDGSQLLVDDIYCTGAQPEGSDVFAPGWLTRSVCTS